MVRIFFVRHSPTQLNLEGRSQSKTDLPPTPEGEMMGNSAGIAIRRINTAIGGAEFKRIYHSDTIRGRITAEKIQRHLGNIPVVANDTFRELQHHHVDGRQTDDVDRESGGAFRTRVRNTPKMHEWKMESMKASGTRMMNGILKLANSHKRGDAIVIVSHHKSITSLLPSLLGKHRKTHRENKVKPASVTVMDINKTVHGLEVIPYFIGFDSHLHGGTYTVNVGPAKKIIVPIRTKKPMGVRRKKTPMRRPMWKAPVGKRRIR